MFLDTISNISVLDLLLPLALILLLSKLLQMGCKKLSLPQVVGMLLAGIILGFIKYLPIGDSILSASAREGIKFLAEIGVVLIMFSAGLGTNLQAIKKCGIASIIVTIFGVIVPLLGGFGIACLFNKIETKQDVYSNLFYGVILTATSVSVTIATLKELGRLSGKAGTIIVSAAILDDIIGVIILSVILSLSGSQASHGFSIAGLMTKNEIASVILNVILFFAFAILIGIGLHYLFKYLNKKMPHKRRIPIFGLVVCFFMSWAAEKWFGVADITGAFVAGLSLAGIGHHINPHRDPLADDTSDYIERKSDVLSYMLFSPIFFANVGLNTDFSGMKASFIGFGLSFVFMGLLSKVVGCGLAAKLTKNSWKDSLRIGVGMMARAEVALICANKGIDAGLINEAMSTFIVIIIIVSSFLTPLILKLTYKNEPLKEDYDEEILEP